MPKRQNMMRGKCHRQSFCTNISIPKNISVLQWLQYIVRKIDCDRIGHFSELFLQINKNFNSNKCKCANKLIRSTDDLPLLPCEQIVCTGKLADAKNKKIIPFIKNFNKSERNVYISPYSASLSHSLRPNVKATNVCKIFVGLTLAKQIGHNFNPKLRYQNSAYQR